MENNRNQQGMDQNQSKQDQNDSRTQSGQQQQTSGQQQQQEDENPQDGSQWNNYQTREMSNNSDDRNQGSSGSNI